MSSAERISGPDNRKSGDLGDFSYDPDSTSGSSILASPNNQPLSPLSATEKSTWSQELEADQDPDLGWANNTVIFTAGLSDTGY
jgi:hypothetical protein